MSILNIFMAHKIKLDRKRGYIIFEYFFNFYTIFLIISVYSILVTNLYFDSGNLDQGVGIFFYLLDEVDRIFFISLFLSLINMAFFKKKVGDDKLNLPWYGNIISRYSKIIFYVGFFSSLISIFYLYNFGADTRDDMISSTFNIVFYFFEIIFLLCLMFMYKVGHFIFKKVEKEYWRQQNN